MKGIELITTEAAGLYYQRTGNVQKAPLSPGIFLPELRVVIAALGIVTTRSIFSHGLHYPSHLLLTHLLALLVFESVQSFFTKSGVCEVDLPCWSQTQLNFSHRAGVNTTIFIISRLLSVSCVIAALVFEYQAILHFTTLPALTMVLVAGSGPFSLAGKLSTGRCFHEAVAILANLCGICLVYVFDRQLSEFGLKASLVSMICSGTAHAIDTWSPVSYGQSLSSIYTPRSEKVMVLLLATAVPLAGIYHKEHSIYAPASLASCGGLIVVNLFASTMTLRSSLSLFRREEKTGFSSEMESTNESGLSSLVAPILLVGLVSTGGALAGSPVAMSVWQYIGFMAALLAIFSAENESVKEIMRGGSEYFPLKPKYADPNTFTIEYTATGKNPSPKSSRYIWQGLILMLCTLMLSLSACLNRSLHPISRQQAMSSTSKYTPPMPISSWDIVVPRFEESPSELAYQLNAFLDLEVLRNRTTRVVVYDVGDDNQEEFQDGLRIALHTEPDILVERRQNTGREAAAFLHHITSRWHDLSDHTLFMQAEPHDLSYARQRLQNYLVSETGFMSLSHVQEVCSNCDRCWDHSSWSESRQVLDEIFARANQTRECEGFLMTYRGQFVASKTRIHAQGKEIFRYLLDELIDPNSEKHGSAYLSQPWLPNKIDSLNNPLFGYTIERLWGAIMQCSDPQLALTCPSLVSTSLTSTLGITPTSIEDCQCIDK